MDFYPWPFILGHYNIIYAINNEITKMTKKEAKSILLKIINNPALADQYTEEEIEELEYIACKT